MRKFGICSLFSRFPLLPRFPLKPSAPTSKSSSRATSTSNSSKSSPVSPQALRRPSPKPPAARLKAAGFPDTDIFLGGASPQKSNLVVRYHGTGKRKPLLLLAHIDVVEAKREDWSIDPFQLIEKDGYFYGRGTGDDKAQAAIWIANLIQYKKEGFVPDRDLIVALTADEEGGGPFNGVAWLLKNHRELIEAEFCAERRWLGRNH